MKPQILHGPAIISSRSKLSSLRKEFDSNNVVVFDSFADLSQILGSLMTPSLLSEEKLFILENPPEDLNLTALPTDLSLVLWFDHEVSDKKPIMEWVKKQGEVLLFPEGKEASIFPFLDLLAEKKPRAFLELKNLQKTHEKFSDLQYIITMIFYLLRSLTVTPKTAPGFVKQKLERQRKIFDPEKIKKLYKEILEIDFKLKSGLLDQPQAEFLLVNKFID